MVVTTRNGWSSSNTAYWASFNKTLERKSLTVNICSDCKYYGHNSETCVNEWHVLSQHKYNKDPITGYWNSVDCREFNSNGKCTRFERPLLQTPIGVWIFLAIVLIGFLIFMTGISVGQHI